jgi:anti-sigma factor RsiW
VSCEEAREVLYDFLTGRLGGEAHRRVEEHVEACQGCREELEELREALSFLDAWKVPELPVGFEERLRRRIAERARERSRSRLQVVIDKVFRPYHIKLPLEGLAVAAVILVALTIYRGFAPEDRRELERGQEGVRIELAEVKNPVILEAGNTEEALDRLKAIVQAHHGQVIQTLWVERGVRVTFSLREEEEVSLFLELATLGKVAREKEGYRDREGNIVVLLREVSAGGKM